MFRKGLTGRQIADLCAQPIAVVNRALGWSKRKDPTLAEEHARNAPPHATAPPLRRTHTWDARFSELGDFYQSNKRMPRTRAGDTKEASLGRWLARQRRDWSGGNLDDEYQGLLDGIGPWRQTARTYSEETRWTQTLLELGEFVIVTQRFPSYRKHTSDTERRLGTWLHTQRQAAHRGVLSAARIADLDASIRGWYTWRPSSGDPAARIR